VDGELHTRLCVNYRLLKVATSQQEVPQDERNPTSGAVIESLSQTASSDYTIGSFTGSPLFSRDPFPEPFTVAVYGYKLYYRWNPLSHLTDFSPISVFFSRHLLTPSLDNESCVSFENWQKYDNNKYIFCMCNLLFFFKRWSGLSDKSHSRGSGFCHRWLPREVVSPLKPGLFLFYFFILFTFVPCTL